MGHASEDELLLEFPELHNPEYCLGWIVPDGWLPLVRATLQALDAHRKHADIQFKVTQIKQKFGELRVYLDGEWSDYANGITELACCMSKVTCESCGKQPSKTRKMSGWLTTLCYACAEATRFR